MEALYLLVFGGMIFLGGTAVVAFYWAVKTNQFRGLENAASVIFDEDEPVGKMTDGILNKNLRVNLK